MFARSLACSLAHSLHGHRFLKYCVQRYYCWCCCCCLLIYICGAATPRSLLVCRSVVILLLLLFFSLLSYSLSSFIHFFLFPFRFVSVCWRTEFETLQNKKKDLLFLFVCLYVCLSLSVFSCTISLLINWIVNGIMERTHTYVEKEKEKNKWPDTVSTTRSTV